VQVVPDLPTFAVDDGFPYRAPDALGEVGLGRIVRVPLGGRRVRGFVVDAAVPPAAVDTARLRDVLAISGDLAVFDERLLRVLRWAALHYVAPVAVLLAKAAPPNLPRRTDPAALPPLTPGPIPRHGPPRYRVNADPAAVAPAVAPYAAAGRSVVVVAPTAAEVDEIGDRLEAVLGPRVVRATSALGARRATAAWVRAATVPGTVLVGTREVAFWPLADPGLAVVVEEGRRAMKEPQSPGVHVRDLARTRGAVERFDVLFQGVVPTAEAIHGGVAVERPAGRAWPLVEIADRSEEPPGGGVIMDRTRRAVAGVVKAGGRAFVFVPRRGYAPAMRCVRCRTVRRCGVCGAGPGREAACRRCGSQVGACAGCGGERFEALGAGVGRVVEDLRRSVGDAAGEAGSGAAVEVGTERDLVGRHDVALAVAVDADALVLAPNYRAGETALRILARVAGTVARGRGHRCIVQTAMADHPVMGALRRGDPLEFLGTVLEERAASGFPPTGQLIAVEVDPVPPGADEALRTAAGSAAVVHGPAPHGDGSRWLVQGGDLHGPRVRLRRVVQEWRDGGARVKVDADPIDL
jgi:primosomal protein N' (replication factor Y) (superfamily II helicase)